MIATGLPASPGAAVGQIVFSAEDAEAWHAQGKSVILVYIVPFFFPIVMCFFVIYPSNISVLLLYYSLVYLIYTTPIYAILPLAIFSGSLCLSQGPKIQNHL